MQICTNRHLIQGLPQTLKSVLKFVNWKKNESTAFLQKGGKTTKQTLF